MNNLKDAYQHGFQWGFDGNEEAPLQDRDDSDEDAYYQEWDRGFKEGLDEYRNFNTLKSYDDNNE